MIEPALTAEEWAEPEHDVKREGFWYYEPMDHGAVYGSGDSGVGIPDEMYAPLIALLNNLLPDSDPRKITRESVRHLRDAIDDTKHQYDVRGLAALADALESYLPPALDEIADRSHTSSPGTT